MNTNTYADETAAGGTNDGGGRRRSLWKAPALITALILLILLLGNHFVDGWNWPPGSFVVVGTLLFGIGLTYELVTRNRDAIAYRAAVGIAFAAAFLLTWGNFVQMADVNPAAAMYFAVPIVGVIGAVVARLRPNGMARALFVTALAQALVLAVVLIIVINRNPQVASWTPPEWRGFGGNAFCIILFAASALLFRKAGRGGVRAGRGINPFFAGQPFSPLDAHEQGKSVTKSAERRTEVNRCINLHLIPLSFRSTPRALS